MIEKSFTRVERLRMMNDAVFISEFNECTSLLEDEFVLQLARLEHLNPLPFEDVELENIGPDHNVDDFGHDVPIPNTPSTTAPIGPAQRCCICLAQWTPEHPPFHITICGHTVGKPCLARWLNSTARNANRCPHCRSALCTRRARRPKLESNTHAAVLYRVRLAIVMLERFVFTQEQCFGSLQGKEYLQNALFAINYRLFVGDVGFHFSCRWELKEWMVRSVNWH